MLFSWTELELLCLLPFPTRSQSSSFHLFISPFPYRASSSFFSLWDSGQESVFTGSPWLWYWVTVVILVFKSLIQTDLPAFSSGAAQISEPNSSMLEKGEVFLRLPLRLLLTWATLGRLLSITQEGNVNSPDVKDCIKPFVPKMRALCASQKRHRNRRTVCAQLVSRHIIRWDKLSAQIISVLQFTMAGNSVSVSQFSQWPKAATRWRDRTQGAAETRLGKEDEGKNSLF